jgi:hypothetical protein
MAGGWWEGARVLRRRGTWTSILSRFSVSTVLKFEMDIESTAERKKQRVLNLNPTNAPEGFHHEGEPAKWFEGKTSRRLRKDKDGPGSRESNKSRY